MRIVAKSFGTIGGVGETMFKRKITINGKSVIAKIGCVHWRDAMIVTKSDGDFLKLPDCISLGFVFDYEDITYVIHNFSSGEVDDYLAIPKGWVVSTYYFKG
jgi:hypothetical protein